MGQATHEGTQTAVGYGHSVKASDAESKALMGEIETKKGKIGKVHDIQSAHQKLIEKELKATDEAFYKIVR